MAALAFVLGCREAPRTLSEAARRGSAAQVADLITPGNVDRPDSAGETPLGIAAGAGNAEAVHALLARGATVDLPDGRGRTALHLAAAAGQDQVIPILLRAGASWKKEDADGRTPLLLAVAAKRSSTAAILRDAALLPQKKGTRPSSHRFGPKAARVPFASMRWTAEPGGDSRFFRMWGNLEHGPWGGLLSVAGGGRTAALSPSAQLRAAVIAGRLTVPGLEQSFGPTTALTVDSRGSYAFVCSAGEACLVYEEEDGPLPRATGLASRAEAVAQGVEAFPPPRHDDHDFILGSLWGSDDGLSAAAFDSIPNRGASGPHSHEFEFLVVGVAGMLRYSVEGDEFVDLPPGSAVVIPAGFLHNVQCVSGKPCVRFYEQD